MAVLIDSENMGMSMEKWEDEGNGIVQAAIWRQLGVLGLWCSEAMFIFTS